MKPSKPSGTPNRLTAPKSSGGSWKTPEPADVLSYAYLWSNEAERGEEGGRKDRPVVVVVARIERENDTLVLVAPIPHSRPSRAADGIEIPAAVKKRLGLDREPSWI